MNIYLVSRNDSVDYDQYDSAVVVAESPERAIEILKEAYQEYERMLWHAWGNWDVSVQSVSLDMEHIVIESFNPG
jgi:hypothetical protein